ncbi:hypothetical protein KFL_000020605 [Klebsormidium nitens]|uniref:PH domain-containing protein n=1 Tax=Klebsormidium nitens TaxID=105231 RepID=A0A1Y1HKN7_KLENI|nr:hypothetical protein KFL_000020605 [Klebsormidium nitens]|eukprot:GAQ77699.1 hypothetical protein KFL_000020605 [Klebsormidium nitens]
MSAQRAYSDFSSTVKRDVERTSGSAAELAQEEQELVQESGKIHTDVQTAWESMNQALQAHRDACAPDDLRPKGAQQKEDPWLTERSLAEAHLQLKKALATYRTRLSDFFDKAKILDGKLVATLHSLLECYTVAVQALAAKTQKHVDLLTAAIAAIEPDTDIAAFEKTLPIVRPPTEAPESPRDNPGQTPAPGGKPGVNALLTSPEVRKKGPVLRMGQVSGQWKEGVLVLTRAGFVHWCHEQEDLLVPVAGATLSLCSVEATSPLEFCVTETERLGKLSLLVRPKQRSLSFKARSADECAAWVVAIKEAIVESNLESLF